jgi:hypothetical protein
MSVFCSGTSGSIRITLRRLSLVSLSPSSYQIWAACDNEYGFTQTKRDERARWPVAFLRCPSCHFVHRRTIYLQKRFLSPRKQNSTVRRSG